MIYSVSRLQLYERCQASFYYKYLLELPESISQPLVLGKTVHTAIEKYLNGDDLDTAVQNARYNAAIELDEQEVYDLASHPTVLSVIGGYVEQHFELPLDDQGRFVIQGYIDYYNHDDSTVTLKDWKTNRSPYEPTANHQMGIYAWALHQLTGANEVQSELVFLRYPNSKRRYVHTYQQPDMEESRQWALSIAMEIESKVKELEQHGDSTILFSDQPGVHCQYCGYAEICIRSCKVDPLTIDSADSAVQLATEAIRLEAALTQYKEQLKSWAKTNGDIVLGDSRFSFVPSISWGFTGEQLYDLCVELHERGVDVFQYLSLTAANLKKIGVDEDKLAVYGKKKVSNTFRLTKLKETA